MIVKKLDFVPQLVWADKDGFWLFGNKLHACDSPFRVIEHFYVLQTPSRTITTLGHGSVFDFNHVKNGKLISSSIAVASKISDIKDGEYLHCYTQYDNRPKEDDFWVLYRNFRNYHKPNYCKENIPHEDAKYDYNGKYLVIAWGNNIWINNFRMRTSATQRGSDIKISPDQSTIIYSTNNFLNIMDIDSKVVKQTLDCGSRIIHLAYALDGLTMAAITRKSELVIWDVE
jgi:hypothetical protein